MIGSTSPATAAALHRSHGTTAVVASLVTQSLDELEAQMLGEVQRLANEGPTEVELDRANAAYEREWLGELAQIDSRADQLGALTTLQGDPHLAEITAVTPDDVARVARTWLAPGAHSVLHYLSTDEQENA